jgi:hypothetical protein
MPNSEPSTPILKFSTFTPRSQTLNLQPSIPDPEPSTLNPKALTPNSQPQSREARQPARSARLLNGMGIKPNSLWQ